MVETFIYDHVRTPRGRGKASGSLHSITPIELASQTLQAITDRTDIASDVIEDITLGCVSPVGEQGANIARIAAINAGYANTVAGKQVNRYCASGLEAVNSAAAEVMSGQLECVIGGGVESMSRVAMGADGGANDPSVAFPKYFVPQGIGADLIATRQGYSRADVDGYAIESQRRAHHAQTNGWFDGSILPVKDQLGEVVLAHDEFIRPTTTVDDLAKLNPSFASMGNDFGFNATAMMRYPDVERINHVHHAGNSSGIVDGAAAVLMGNKDFGDRQGLKPRARIRSFATVGSEPTIMLTGPVASTQKALKLAGMEKSDIDLFELNEAFASVVLYFMESLNISHSDINVNGGSIAMGHPLGATGAMILGTVLDELERRDLETGLATLCVGLGMGITTIIERV